MTRKGTPVTAGMRHRKAFFGIKTRPSAFECLARSKSEPAALKPKAAAPGIKHRVWFRKYDFVTRNPVRFVLTISKRPFTVAACREKSSWDSESALTAILRGGMGPWIFWSWTKKAKR